MVLLVLFKLCVAELIIMPHDHLPTLNGGKQEEGKHGVLRIMVEQVHEGNHGDVSRKSVSTKTSGVQVHPSPMEY